MEQSALGASWAASLGPFGALFKAGDEAPSDSPAVKAYSGPDDAVYKAVDKDGMETKWVNLDLHAERNEYIFRLPAFVEDQLTPHMNDIRDLPLVRLFFNIMVTTVPGYFALWIFAAPWWVMVLAITCNYLIWFTTFVLGFHYQEHRPIFKRDSPLAWLNQVPGYFLCFFFGFVPGGYKLHHCIMHHIENNQGEDLSATMYYQRNNFKHFLWYWFRHLFGVWIELALYAWRKGRKTLARDCLVGCIALYVSTYLLLSVFPVKTFWTVIAPHVITSFFLMFGNWCQHLFVDPKNPFSNTHLAYNVVNNGDNQISFNDGYHVIHHENGRCHWSEMPAKFMKDIPRFVEEECINFEGVGIFHIGLWVFTDNWRQICKHYLHLPGARRKSDEELIAMFKERLQIMPRTLVGGGKKAAKTKGS